MYTPDDTPHFKHKLTKLRKRDKPRYERLVKKMQEILTDPRHYKELGNIMAGTQRVHTDPFVLTFEVDENRKVVCFLDFEHHHKVWRATLG